mmetsp:Transcript_138599/g.241008  ORF Transcript_138599/g.241008 Transcript_138599/m.241008 type:complete len:282 (+) Transcript_138599:764-1609(+)
MATHSCPNRLRTCFSVASMLRRASVSSCGTSAGSVMVVAAETTLSGVLPLHPPRAWRCRLLALPARAGVCWPWDGVDRGLAPRCGVRLRASGEDWDPADCGCRGGRTSGAGRAVAWLLVGEGWGGMTARCWGAVRWGPGEGGSGEGEGGCKGCGDCGGTSDTARLVSAGNTALTLASSALASATAAGSGSGDGAGSSGRPPVMSANSSKIRPTAICACRSSSIRPSPSASSKAFTRSLSFAPRASRPDPVVMTGKKGYRGRRVREGGDGARTTPFSRSRLS